jgi:hypothetical protein
MSARLHAVNHDPKNWYTFTLNKYESNFFIEQIFVGILKFSPYEYSYIKNKKFYCMLIYLFLAIDGQRQEKEKQLKR